MRKTTLYLIVTAAILLVVAVLIPRPKAPEKPAEPSQADVSTFGITNAKVYSEAVVKGMPGVLFVLSADSFAKCKITEESVARRIMEEYVSPAIQTGKPVAEKPVWRDGAVICSFSYRRKDGRLRKGTLTMPRGEPKPKSPYGVYKADFPELMMFACMIKGGATGNRSAGAQLKLDTPFLKSLGLNGMTITKGEYRTLEQLAADFESFMLARRSEAERKREGIGQVARSST